MSVDGTFTATVDRVEGTTAVVLLEEDGDVVEQLDLDVERLPEAGQREGALLEVEIADGELVDATSQPKRERRRRDRIREKLDRLSKRLGDE